MISKKDIKKLAKKVFKKQNGLRDHQIIHPNREWTIALLASFILLLSGAAWSFFAYNDISQFEVQNENSAAIQQTIYRNDLVLSSLNEFRERKDQYQELLKQRETLTIPEEVVSVTDENIDPTTSPDVNEAVEELDVETDLDQPVELDIN